MKRFCYFCRKPLGIEKRAEMFCGLRCQMLYAQLDQAKPGRILPAQPQQQGGQIRRGAPTAIRRGSAQS